MVLRRLGLSFRFRRRGLNLLNYLIDDRSDRDKPNGGEEVFTYVQFLHTHGI